MKLVDLDQNIFHGIIIRVFRLLFHKIVKVISSTVFGGIFPLRLKIGRLNPRIYLGTWVISVNGKMCPSLVFDGSQNVL